MTKLTTRSRSVSQTTTRNDESTPLVAHKKNGTHRHITRDNKCGWLLTTPSVVILAILAIAPTIAVMIVGLSPSGITQFGALVDNPTFPDLIKNTALWIIYCMVGTLLLGYSAAFSLSKSTIRLRGLWRTILLIPWITTSVTAAVAWKWILGDQFGILNRLLIETHIISEPISWLTNTSTVLPIVALVQVWTSFPFVMLLVSAALTAIPNEHYEAATLDGANAWARLRYISLPAIREITFVVVLMVATWSLNSFVPIWIMTEGGPAGASNILPIALYQSFQNGNMSSVAAIALIQLAASMILGGIYVRRLRSTWDD